MVYKIPTKKEKILFIEENIPRDSIIKRRCLKQIFVEDKKDFVVEIKYNKIPPKKLVSFNVNNIALQYYPMIEQVRIKHWNPRALIYTNKFPYNGGELKLTIRKINNFLHFFINEKFIHQMDYQFSASLKKIGGSAFRDTDIDFSLKFSYLEY